MKRLDYIDAAKGIGILLMVLGHIWTDSCAKIVIWLYSFHVPMFFILSGMVVKYTGNLDKKPLCEIIKRKCQQLLVPYIVFEILYVVLIGSRHSFNYDILQWHWYDGLMLKPVNGPLWFLLCLLFVEIAFVCIHTFIKNDKLNCTVALILYIVPFLIKTDNAQASFAILCCTAYGFFSLGYYMFDFVKERELSWVKILSLLFAGVILAMINQKTNMYELNYKNPFLYSINAFITSMALVFLFKRVRIKFLEFWGKNSIVMLALHVLCMSIICKVLLINYQTFCGGLLLLFLVCMVLFPVAVITNKFMPQLVGKRK